MGWENKYVNSIHQKTFNIEYISIIGFNCLLREEKIKIVSEENGIQQNKIDLNLFQHNM
jgi:hypothetical protein